MKRPAHELASRRILLPLATARRALRPSRRPELHAYREGMRFRSEALHWDDEARREWVLRRLRHVMRSAARETVYYRELFARIGFDPASDFGFEEFARLPVLERVDVRERAADLVSSAIAPSDLVRNSTGGSTGVPTEVWQGPEERGWGESGTEFPMSVIGVPSGTGVARLWGHHLDPVARETLRQRLHDFEANVRWFDCFRVSPEIFERYHLELERWRPACVVAYASALAGLAEHIVERKHQPGYPTRCFITGGEKLLPAQRAQIEESFGRPVHERYGSREVGPIAFQYMPRATLDYTVDWANVLVEPETGDHETSILLTKLHADGTAMIRYRIGDIGLFEHGSRPGHPSFVLPAVIGRDIDRICLPGGRWISPIAIAHLMKDYPVREFQFLQREDYSVQIQIAPRPGFGEASRNSILKTVRDNLPGVPVDVVVIDAVPRSAANKLRPIVSEVARKPPGTEANS